MLAPDESYPTTNPRPTPSRRGVSRRSVIDAAKEAVSTLELAEHLATEQGKQLRPAGRELLVSCLLPDHEDRTPSFYLDPEKDLWFCHGCLRGGDAIELARFAWGIENPATAAAEVLLSFGREVPPRPPAWFRKQKRQAPIRDAISRARFEHLRRRLYRAFFAPSVARIEDVEEREAEAQILWESTEPLARHVLSGMMGGGRDGR